MSHIFCHSCGTKLSYAHAKPNLCAKCAQQLNAATASTNTAEGLKTLEKSVVVSADETDAQSVPSLAKIEVEYDTSDHVSYTVGSLVGEGNPQKSPKGGSRSFNEFIDEKKAE